jgi:NAD(P)-dependent dehydrogenase (short-subunit alcohol dehydrogenase family)
MQVSEAERLFQEVLRHYGRIDIAVNATGRHFKKPIIETKSIEWEEVSCWLAVPVRSYDSLRWR